MEPKRLTDDELKTIGDTYRGPDQWDNDAAYDVAALLAHADALAAEVARLREALQTVCDESYELHTWERGMYPIRHTFSCPVCDSDDEPTVDAIEHRDDCPIAAARRALLEGGA